MDEKSFQRTVYYGARDREGGALVKRSRDGVLSALWRDPAWTGGALLDWDWGAVSPGAQLLAMALLSDVLGASSIAALWCEDFAREVVATWPGERWTVDSNAVCVWLVRKTVEGLQKRGEEPDPCWRRERLFGPGCSELKRPSNGAGGGGGK